jgi:pantetheine-phosphate adenylyltransferase
MAISNMALYPGSFDPITHGHLNLVSRGLKLFDRVLIAVAVNARKTPLFTAEERVRLIRESLGDNERVEVDVIDGLLVHYAEKKRASCIMRGLRAVSDFEYEFQLAHMNRRLAGGLETVFMMTGEEHFYVSSQMVREVASLGGNVQGLVPPHVEQALKGKFS